MADMYEDTDVQEPLNSGRLAAAGMIIGGTLLAVVTTVWCLVRCWQLSQMEAPVAADFFATAAFTIAGWTVALLSWGGAALLRRLDEIHMVLAEGRPAAPVAAPGRQVNPAAIEQLNRRIDQLAQLALETRDIALLTEEERRQRAEIESQALAGQLDKDIPALLREHNWQEAQLRLQRARTRFPALPIWERLAEQVEQARIKFEKHDVETTTREVDELLALGELDRAATLVRDLQRRHPDAREAVELGKRVATALDRASAEERAELMAKAQEATDQRRWTDALRHVEEVMKRFPNSPEAQDLRQQLPTVRSNAEIQTRQRAETEITELIRQHRYDEALERARALIDRYPDSPQARALRDQIPRLQQRAEDMGQRRRR